MVSHIYDFAALIAETRIFVGHFDFLVTFIACCVGESPIIVAASKIAPRIMEIITELERRHSGFQGTCSTNP